MNVVLKLLIEWRMLIVANAFVVRHLVLQRELPRPSDCSIAEIFGSLLVANGCISGVSREWQVVWGWSGK